MTETVSNILAPVAWYRGFQRYLVETPQFGRLATLLGGAQGLEISAQELLNLHYRCIGFMHHSLDPELRNAFASAVRAYAEACGAGMPSLDDRAARHVEELDDRGFTVLSPVSVPLTSSLKERFQNMPLMPWGETEPSKAQRMERLRGACNVALVPRNLLGEVPELLSIGLDPDVLGCVAGHLGAPPLLLGIEAWVSFAKPDEDISARDAQLFHFDLDDYRFVKQFVYLTDVDEGTGPHVYAPTTHRPKEIREMRSRHAALNGGAPERFDEWYFGALRKTDDEVREICGVEPVSITAPAGTRILANTEGLHKGAIPRTGDRWMVQFLYGISAQTAWVTGAGVPFPVAELQPYLDGNHAYSAQLIHRRS